MKKLLSTRLKERTETIEFRQIKKKLNIAAENRRSTFTIWKIAPETIIMLENEGITVREIVLHNINQFELSW